MTRLLKTIRDALLKQYVHNDGQDIEFEFVQSFGDGYVIGFVRIGPGLVVNEHRVLSCSMDGKKIKFDMIAC